MGIKITDPSGGNEVALHNLLRGASNRSSHILITGDFNYRGIYLVDWSSFENATSNTCFMEDTWGSPSAPNRPHKIQEGAALFNTSF